MWIINSYLSKAITKSMLVVWFVFVAMNILFGFLGELEDIEGDFGVAAAFVYALLNSADFAVKIFPLSLLVGSVFALGKLSDRSELTIILASGVSMLKVLRTVLLVSLGLVVLVMAFTEIAVPKSEQAIQKLLNHSKNTAWFHDTKHGVWMISDDTYLHIRDMKDPKNAKGVSVYYFDETLALTEIQNAERAYIGDDGVWSLFGTKTTDILSDRVSVSKKGTLQIRPKIASNVISKIQVRLDRLSSPDLWAQYQFLQKNRLSTERVAQAIWERVAYPFSALVMVFFAFPLVLKSNRTITLGQKIFTGVLIGLVYFVFSKIIEQLGFIFNVPSPISVFFPVVLFLFFGMRLYRKI